MWDYLRSRLNKTTSSQTIPTRLKNQHTTPQQDHNWGTRENLSKNNRSLAL